MLSCVWYTGLVCCTYFASKSRPYRGILIHKKSCHMSHFHVWDIVHHLPRSPSDNAVKHDLRFNLIEPTVAIEIEQPKKSFDLNPEEKSK